MNKVKFEETEAFQNNIKQLNLVKNIKEIYDCQGRIQGDYPTYIPKNSKLAERIIQHSHKKTLYGGVYTNNDRSERSILDPKFKTVNEKNYQKLLWLQTISYQGIQRTTTWTTNAR